MTNISKSFTHKMAAKKSTGIDMEQNYVTVALCITAPDSQNRCDGVGWCSSCCRQIRFQSPLACQVKKITKYKYAVSNVDPYKIRTHKSIYILPIRN